MGAESSKPQSDIKTHVWQSETPVSFSQPFVESLQSSSETDSSRAKTLELHIQSRVAAELKKLQDQASKEYESISAKISASEPKEKTGEQKAGDKFRDLGRESVQKDVQHLRKKLEKRKMVKQVDESVEKAKSKVVRCLRENDRRPLDCWKEVERFKVEVRRLEGVWVEKIVR